MNHARRAAGGASGRHEARMDPIKSKRAFMKSEFGGVVGLRSDQSRGVPPPPVQKPHAGNAALVALPKPQTCPLVRKVLMTCLQGRRSRRRFLKESITQEELSFLLWATQGIDEADPGGHATLRPAPSAGARHPFETYIIANRVAGLTEGVYRYLPLTHQLVFEFAEPDLPRKVGDATLGQTFVGDGAAVFVWSCIPYRGEWRYTVLAHKVMLIDAGHVCQNLYLACESIGCGTCAIGAYDQEAMDTLLRLDGDDEFVVYLAPVGRVGR